MVYTNSYVYLLSKFYTPKTAIHLYSTLDSTVSTSYPARAHLTASDCRYEYMKRDSAGILRRFSGTLEEHAEGIAIRTIQTRGVED